MPCPHFSISIVKGSKGQSAVASAAYNSGEKLFSERDMKNKDYSRKKEVAEKEIMLPPHAPPEFMDRERLWNSVEGNEKRFDAQYARKIVAALPREISKEDYQSLVREYCQENFVNKGMCCDYAIHDKGDGNPHVHILLTMRAIDEKGKWLPKSRMVYVLDEKGDRIKLPSGNFKSRKENTVDWDNKKYAEVWRQEWGKITNRYLERNGRTERLDMRSYKRQGKEEIPTVHMGGAALGLERKGIDTFIGNLNRKIKTFNDRRKSIMEEIKDVRLQLLDIAFIPKEVKDKERRGNAVYALLDYMDVRKQERFGWSQGAEIKCGTKDLKEISLLVGYLQNNDIHTISEFKDFRDKKFGAWNKVNSSINDMKKRVKEIEGILSNLEIRKANKEVHNNYVKIPWKAPKNLYYGKHKAELEAFNKADRFIRKWYSDGKVPVKSIQEEKRKLESEIEDIEFKRDDMSDEISWVKKIDSILRKIRPEMYEKKKEKEVSEKRSDNDEPAKPRERKSVIKLMETKKKELDERERAERGRGPRIIKKDRHEPSL